MCPFGPVHSKKPSAGIRQRRCRIPLRNQGMVATVSAPALGTALEYARLTFLDAAASGPAVLLVRPVRGRGASPRGEESALDRLASKIYSVGRFANRPQGEKP